MSRKSTTEPADPVLRPSAVFLWAAVAVVVTVGLTATLVRLSSGVDPQRLPRLLDIVRIGLSVGAGTGGLFALWLATRRQRSAEQTLALQREVSRTTVADSTERRITEQYNKAIEQMGHEKAAVRLGAIYSLERLAQEHVGHQQTIVDVFCSYLRLPFEPPADRRKRVRANTRLRPEVAESLAELEVRYTVQSILWEHLGDPEQREVAGKRWPEIDLDLSRTTLIDPVLRQLAVRTLKCEDIVVHGTADFRGLRVTGIAGISGSFHGRAIFAEAVFTGGFALIDCTFDAEVDLSGAVFQEQLTVTTCHFHGEVNLSGCSSRYFAGFNCQFDHDLVLRDGKCPTIMIFESDFQGKFATDGVAIRTALLAGCSFRVPPERNPMIVVVNDLHDQDSFRRDVAAHFGIELDTGER